MQFDDFRRIVTCFADHVDDVDTSQGELLVQIRDETISARLHQRPKGLIVEEGDQRLSAESWIVNRVARVPLLAERICSYVSPPPCFVKPSGHFLDQPESSDEDSAREDVVETLDRDARSRNSRYDVGRLPDVGCRRRKDVADRFPGRRAGESIQGRAIGLAARPDSTGGADVSPVR